MQRQAMRTANREQTESSGRRWLLLGVAAAVGLAGGGWWLLQPSRTARIATRTITLQDQLLGATVDPAARRTMLREIMHNVDQLRPDEIRVVREALYRRINTMREESLTRFTDAAPVERTALLDDDLERIRLARKVLDATDQGGMRPFTEAELVEREERRKQQQEGKRNPPPARASTAAKPSPPPRPSPEDQQLMKVYFESLAKRAKEKNVDLGRMFGRPPGRG
jgi:pyruvate/2-oxoglutarate dehydrogenase complex dihydrolipoamide acyltransferase (E2) component